jgi:proton-translocating NADH-quinone oxidoreductase chain M
MFDFIYNYKENILFLVLITPLIGSILILFTNQYNILRIKQLSLGFSLLTFNFSILLWLFFDSSSAKFQFVQKLNWIPFYNLNFYIGIDGISLFFILLTTLLIPICLLSSWNSNKVYIKEYVLAFLIMESLLIAVFCVLDLLLFYIFFESVLIPMFIIVGLFGSRTRKIRAAFMFFLYTLFGSLFMLLAILFIYSVTGTTDYQILLTTAFTEYQQKILWIAFFASFATKIPMLPVHIWLPEAHVEAPTEGSVILAGVLLKLGSYGFIRYSLPLFPFATLYFTPFINTLAVIGIIYTSLTAIRQTDLKRIIAYASVAHMNLVMIGMFSLNIQGVEGSILQMISHGIVSSSLFLCIGVIYDRHHTRLVKYYSGLVQTMPIYVTLFLFFTLANIALPGTSSFISEFLILFGIFQTNTTITFFAATGMILGGIYSLWLFNRISFGNIRIQYFAEFADVTRREFYILMPLAVITLIMGIFPDFFLEPMNVSVYNLIEHIRIQ